MKKTLRAVPAIALALVLIMGLAVPAVDARADGRAGVTESIAAGFESSFAVRDDGGLWAWGSNKLGRLGDGTTVDRVNPVRILSDVASVSAGSSHALAIKENGSLWAWGWNAEGQLGDGTSRQRLLPVEIMKNTAAVSAGGGYNIRPASGGGEITSESAFSVAIKTDGSLWAWGDNTYGQLGNGSTRRQLSPVEIMKDVVVVSAGAAHTMAIKKDGSLWAWGCNAYGQLGDGSTRDKFSPVEIMKDVAAVSAGGAHTVAVKKDGTLLAWGWNVDGQLGDGSTRQRLRPVEIMKDAVSVSAGGGYTVISTSNVSNVFIEGGYTTAIKKDGSQWSWGSNKSGQLGDGSNRQRLTPVKIQGDVAAISAGDEHAMALRADGSLWAWGSNVHGRLGDGTNRQRVSPTRIMSGVMLPGSASSPGQTPPTTPPTTPPPASDIKVYLNGRLLSFDVEPRIANGSTLVPLRAIFQEMGATVSWNSSTHTVTARKGTTVVVLTIGDNSPTINGQVKPISQPGIVVGGRTLAPLRFVAEAFGGTVSWDPASRTIRITS